ncbi:MAG: sulfatase-like hydrolase/transferase [Chlorobi bacterium]|nr:sulfatase-like hydrolase/transferase [Chlorobiota bacterium]
MKQGILTKRTLISAIGILLLAGACTYPFTTASRKWKIKYDKDKIAFKEDFLNRHQDSAVKTKAPNIVLIVVDDLGKSEVSAYGSQTMKTPNIDKIAQTGVLFTDCYVTSPVCSPSRAAILTGRYPTRYGFETQPMEFYPNNMLVYASGKYLINTSDYVMNTKPRYPAEWQIQKQGVPPSEINLAELLKTKQYNTACIGKWHLGFSKDHIPNARGFDYQFGFYGAFSLYSKKRNSPNMVSYIQDIYSSKYQWKHGRQGTSAIRRNNKVVKEDRYLTNAFLEEAIEYMAVNKSRKNPFFLYLAFSAPHVPFQAPRSYYEMHADTKDENKRTYYAMIHVLDDAIGFLMKTMEMMGLDENTLVFFISDNGGATYTGATTNYPYKGGKLTWFEGGLNVPFMMKWKGHLPEGVVYDKPVSAMDIFMTTVKTVGITLPGDRVYDGVNLIPFVTGTKKGYPHKALYWRADHIYAMRNKNWKFLMSIRDNWAELYNISIDKYEHIDMYKQDNDTLQKMLRQFNIWQKGLKKPLWPRLMDVKFVIDGKTYLFPS